MTTLLRLAEGFRALWELIPIRGGLAFFAGVMAILHPTAPQIVLAALFMAAYMGSQVKATFPGGGIEFGGGTTEEPVTPKKP